MRIAVTGREGQLVRALLEYSEPGLTVVPVGRPELDLARLETVFPALKAVDPDVIVNAAAYTAVDRAEEEFLLATVVNWHGAETVAEAARRLGCPLVQLSTDYVFNGKKAEPYTEKDVLAPLNIYGTTKRAGEVAVARVLDDYVVLRTSWLYAPYGKNFVRTMVRLAREGKEEVRVVADAVGTPTYAPDLAEAVVGIARALTLSPADRSLRGTFHYAGAGETSWADFAKEIFTMLAFERGWKVPRVIPIRSSEYSTAGTATAAERPLNSRLECSKLAEIFGITAPEWRGSLARCLDEMLAPCGVPPSSCN